MRPYFARLLDAVRGRADEPVPYLSVSVGGVTPEQVAELGRQVTLDLARQVQIPPDVVRRKSLEDVDPALVEVLREAGRVWGPLGVALTAAQLTDPDVLIASLRAGNRLPAQPDPLLAGEPWARHQAVRNLLLDHHPEQRSGPQGPITGCQCGDLALGQGWSDHTAALVLRTLGVPGHQPLDGTAVTVQDRTDEQPAAPVEESEVGWSQINAGQAVEFMGRQIRLPFREGLPRGPQTLIRAWTGRLDPTSSTDDGYPVVYLLLEHQPVSYALAYTDTVMVRSTR